MESSRRDLGNHTCSHSDLNSTPLQAYKADTLRRESHGPRFSASSALLPASILHAGKKVETKRSITSFLRDQGYTIAPLTLTIDYMFAVYAKAQQRNDTTLADRIRATYLAYLDSSSISSKRDPSRWQGTRSGRSCTFTRASWNADTMLICWR